MEEQVCQGVKCKVTGLPGVKCEGTGRPGGEVWRNRSARG